VDTFFHALYTQKSTRMTMLLGTACSDVTESLANVMPYWNIVQVATAGRARVEHERALRNTHTLSAELVFSLFLTVL
jgi:hypothetical protein